MIKPHRPNSLQGICQGFAKILGAVPVVAFLPSAAFACALPPSIILTLPTGWYMAGAALTVLLTALFGAAADHLPDPQPRVLWQRRVILPETLTSYVAFLCFLGLLAVGWLGARDPMHNLMTLVFWTGVWIALPLGSMLLGNLWRPLNPWTGPVRITRTLLNRTGSIGLNRLGHLPAVLGYGGFVWFQIISMAPDDPFVLATAAAAYWLVIFALAVLEGDQLWLRGEILRPDGSKVIAGELRGAVNDGADLGRALADDLLGRAGPGFFG
jgi:hypothetical protein